MTDKVHNEPQTHLTIGAAGEEHGFAPNEIWTKVKEKGAQEVNWGGKRYLFKQNGDVEAINTGELSTDELKTIKSTIKAFKSFRGVWHQK